MSFHSTFMIVLQELVAGFLDVQTTQSVLAVRSDHSRVWFVGTSTGRLFALSNDGAQVGKILWKRRLISPDESIAGSASWNQLLIVAPEKQSTRPVLAACLSHTDVSCQAVTIYCEGESIQLFPNGIELEVSSYAPYRFERWTCARIF